MGIQDSYFKWDDRDDSLRGLKELVTYYKSDIGITTKGIWVNNTNTTHERLNKSLLPGIVKVIFNDPATVVIWEDGSKTVVKCNCESFDPEKGLAMAIAKKALGNEGNYYETFKHVLNTWPQEQLKAVDILKDMYRSKPKKRRR